MNVIAKDVAPAGLDPTAWREQLLTLNPWARGLTTEEDNAEFATARQKATLARHAEGKEVWNGWANGMLALKAALEAAGQWASTIAQFKPWLPSSGKNEATRAWLALASAVFSTGVLKNRFEMDVSSPCFIFPGDAWFERAVFERKVQFEHATFGGLAQFMNATFHGEVGFRHATFDDAARFEAAVFRNVAWFRDAAFGGEARFAGATFRDAAGFERASFGGEARFSGATFGGAAWFDDATFLHVPSFIGATFKGALRVDQVSTPSYPWLGYTPNRDATARFRELKRRAVEAQDRERELEFFAQEIRTARFHAKGLPSWVPKVWSWRFWFGLGFGALSDFGRSLWRPLVSWLALAALCAAFYLGEHADMRKAPALAPAGPFSTLAAYAATTGGALANPPPCRIAGREPFASTDAVTEALQLSLKNALVFNLGSADSTRRTFGCLYGPEQDGNQQYLSVPVRVSMASTGQALASGLLIFLFVLAVGNQSSQANKL